jgi:hypothetical protein
MPLILTEKDRFNAMVKIASGLTARSHSSPSEIAVEVDAYLKEIVNFVNSHPQASKRTPTSSEIT